MTPEEIKLHLAEMNPDAVVFDGPDYSSALVGVTHDCRAVYDRDLCINCLVADGATYEEAVEFFEFNTVRALPYMGDQAPVIVEMMRKEE